MKIERLAIADDRDGAVWWMRARPAPMHRLSHRHSELELNLVVAGRARYIIADQRCELAPNTLIWLFPAQPHVLVGESDDFAMWIAVFSQSMVQHACRLHQTEPLRQSDPPSLFVRNLHHDRSRSLAQLCASTIDAPHADAFNASLRYLLMQAWTATTAASNAPGALTMHPAVERAVDLLTNETHPISLDQLAQQAGLSASRLSRVFAQQVGQSITDFRNAQRIERLCRTLQRQPAASLIDLALRAGFGSYPQFHRVFTKKMGLSPVRYRRLLRRTSRSEDEKAVTTDGPVR